MVITRNKVRRINSLATTLKALAEAVQGSGVHVKTSGGGEFLSPSERTSISIKMSVEQRKEYLRHRREQMVLLWQSAMLVFDYLNEERVVVNTLLSGGNNEHKASQVCPPPGFCTRTRTPTPTPTRTRTRTPHTHTRARQAGRVWVGGSQRRVQRPWVRVWNGLRR
jgi:hypothetical protein